MRVVSQNGKYDLPYNQLFLEIRRKKRKEIYEIVDIRHKKLKPLAVYSSKEAVEAAMIGLSKEYYQFKVCISYKRYRFPADEIMKGDTYEHSEMHL